MNRLIIIEGPDNTGKTVLTMQLAKHYRSTHDVMLMHSIKPNTKLKSPKALLDFQHDVFFSQAIKIVKMCDDSLIGDNVVIMDRAWYGEYVYGQIYRKENPEHIVEMIKNIDDYLYSFNIKRSTILTNASPEFVFGHDDNKSFFSEMDEEKKLNAISREINLFNECFAKTLLADNRFKETFKILDVEGADRWFVRKDILLDSVLNFIEGEVH